MAIETITSLSLADAEAAVRAALTEQGFGVLTEIDIAATLRTKLGVERPPMKILGACNPAFAHEALQRNEAVSLLLPCNVVLTETGEGTKVAAVDPHDMIPDPAFTDLADEAYAKLSAAVSAVPR